MSGRKVELDEVIVPSPLLESSSSLISVPVIPTPISEEANDIDHETSDQVTTKPRRSTRVRSAPDSTRKRAIANMDINIAVAHQIQVRH